MRRNFLKAERGSSPPGNAGAGLTVALVYPNTYHIGMSSLGYQITYRAINDHPDARATNCSSVPIAPPGSTRPSDRDGYRVLADSRASRNIRVIRSFVAWWSGSSTRL